ncbi:MAG TPA: hypothetical protein VJA21_26215 [Verrucomicrobiae bacterium]
MKSEGGDPKAETRPKHWVRRAIGRALRHAPAIAVFAAAAACGQQGSPANSAANLQERGVEIIRRFVEVNRYWLAGPSAEIQNFAYTLNRLSGSQHFEVTEPASTSRAKLHGVTYWAMLQQLAQSPKSATVRGIDEEQGRIRLVLSFNPAIRGACGNGVEGSWNGYHTLGGDEGFVVIDTQRWVPLEAQVGRLHETFGEFALIADGHYAPLKIKIQIGDTTYDWRFRIYEPGLWLFDDSLSGNRRLAWLEDVRVNSSPAKVKHATESSIALEESRKTGSGVLEAFLKANRHWLLPSLETRRGLVYEYRQETPYLERVAMDAAGNVLVRLESNNENQDRPTRQCLWLPDGRSYRGDVNDRFINLPPLQPSNAPALQSPSIQRDRLLQHLAMGLALDCALTRLAREPDQFRAEMRLVPNQAGRYLLVLHPKGNARLFTGTMLAFTSWSYMHDVAYERSEVLCDAATHRPIEEKDYAGASDLKGHYLFDNWIDDAGGAAPGRIRAVVPHEKDGKDQSLEMTARFGFARPGVWLLEEVQSHFRGATGGSTGAVSVLAYSRATSAEINELLRKAEYTQGILAGIQEAPEAQGAVMFSGTNWSPVSVKAAWTDQARQAAKDREKDESETLLVGTYRARLLKRGGDSVHIEIEGVSTASWKEFLTSWKATLEDDRGAALGSGSADLKIRAENGPSPFSVLIQISRDGNAPFSLPAQVAISGTVQRLTGAYHGHGIWFTLLDKE